MAIVAGDGRRPDRRAVVLLGIGVTLAESRIVDHPQVVMTTTTMIKTALTSIDITDGVGNHAAPNEEVTPRRTTMVTGLTVVHRGTMTS